MRPDRALIVFAKPPRVGEVKTRLGETIGMEKAAAIYRQFAEHAFGLARGSAEEGTLVHLFYTPGAGEEEMSRWLGASGCLYREQVGETLGERMRSAFLDVFKGGAHRAIIIGTDVPELEMPMLRGAFAMLEEYQVVVGPSSDGGYYLLGMQAPLKELFEGIDWSTSAVMESTEARLKALELRYTLLPELADIDTEPDYRAYLERRGRGAASGTTR
jgi:rSAM/selenodomain-associated transferase 1